MVNKVKVLGVIGNPLTPPRWEIIAKFLRESQFETLTYDSTDDLELQQVLKDVDYLIVGRKSISDKHLQYGTRIKLIQIVGSQSDHIDLASAHKIGIAVATMPLPHLAAVAEQAFMFMLALSHKLLQGHRETVEGVYVQSGLTPTKTSETLVAGNWTKIPDITALYGKYLGIVGMGEIGRFMAKMGQGFSMHVLYFKRNRLSKIQEEALGIEYRDFETLLKQSDFISPAVPHTPEAERMFGQREFSLMKPSAFFVNCSRGGIVDQKALFQALKDKVIAGAGLDVYEKEPIPAEDPILKLDNVICTPHSAGTMEELTKGCKMICENIVRVHRGEPPHNLIRP